MTLESLMRMQLCVMDPSEVAAAAGILKKAHPTWEEVGAQFYDGEVLPKFIAALKDLPILVGKIDREICAAYQISTFTLEGGNVVFGKKREEGVMGTSYEGIDDYFAVDKEQCGRGMVFFTSLADLLEQVASKLRAPLVHRVQATNRSRRLFAKCGYSVVHFSEGLRFDYYVMEKAYLPIKHELLPSEQQVVGLLFGLASQQTAKVAASLVQQTI